MKKETYQRILDAGRAFGLSPRSAIRAFEEGSRPLKGEKGASFLAALGGENARERSEKSLHLELRAE